MSSLALLLATTLAAPAAAAPFDQILTPDGWEVAGTARHDLLGEVTLSLKTVQGVLCLQGAAQVAARPQTMLGVVEDIDGALSWSRAGLVATRVLGRTGSSVDYYQHLDVPDWTMASDRYWVLRSDVQTRPDGALVFRWDRFDWRSAYPELATQLDRDYPKAVEPQPNFGAWSFRSQGEGSELRYVLCTESGSLPGWLQKAAATKTVPDAMADVVREAQKRGG